MLFLITICMYWHKSWLPDGRHVSGYDWSPRVSGDGMAEALKHSPHNGRGTPRDDIPPGGTPNDMVPYNLQYQDNVSRRDRATI